MGLPSCYPTSPPLPSTVYQSWFVKRFNTAVFGNELKWYATEKEAGKVNYSVADAMVSWCEAQGLNIRGHNIVWDDPHFQQPWVKALASKPDELRQAVMARVNSVVSRYAGRFIAWDVSNEQLHFSFYEDALSDPSFSTSLFLDVQCLDPGAQLFVNDYNTLENANDPASIPDALLLKLHELRAAGVLNLAIGLEAHFTKPDLAYMRSTLDKLGTLGLPIWLTELDINVQALPNHNISQAAIYLEDILREAFSHPAVKGIVMWTSWEPSGCYRMCLTDNNMDNLATGNVVDALLNEWQQVDILAESYGSIKWRGPHGTHNVSIRWNNITYYSSLCVEPGKGTQRFIVELPMSSNTLEMHLSSASSSM
ncbi:hypothetical protein KP509_30G035800 [Ceratopteris richardii]|uniref:GH10 domain-containing protein n=1 Tax=Ceratopteris richardii TaxID=49495 RepID=A0A8T2R1M9_CERRI|nr:hypothetical protein KP509_30G035800 [Ceratopteris richardii]